MKHRFFQIFVLLLLLVSVLSSVACGTREEVPTGTYSCIAADTGEQYIFVGSRVRVVLYMMGEIAVDYTGTYRLSNGKIKLNFPNDDGLYSGTFDYAISEDGSEIVIGDVTFVKE